MKAASPSRPPDPTELLQSIAGNKPLAIVLAGHNGSGKSTLWYDNLVRALRIPLINADRLTLSLLPPSSGHPPTLDAWAADLRDHDERWQRLSQEGVQLFMGLIMEQRTYKRPLDLRHTFRFRRNFSQIDFFTSSRRDVH